MINYRGKKNPADVFVWLLAQAQENAVRIIKEATTYENHQAHRRLVHDREAAVVCLCPLLLEVRVYIQKLRCF